ncbi:hypothetical protein KUTeg_022438, partial [Tegillarca granosa]
MLPCGKRLLIIIAVSASMTEKLLKVPLFQVGELWLKSASDIIGRILSIFTTVPDFYAVSTYIVIPLVLVSVYYLYVLFFVPLNRIRILGDIGYIEEGKFSMKEIANSVRKRRLVGDIPPVYPNGWFGVVESFQIKKGEAKNISMIGLNLAVFRAEDGHIHAIDAYCPHMGANLAAGGRVVGNCLECPFHGWLFRGHDGKCTKIPYAEKVPEGAGVKSYVTLETNGWIYLWHHAEGIEPNWTPPALDEVNNGNWTYRGRSEHYVNSHIEEIPENGADVYHLQQVHGPIMTAGIDLRYMWNQLWSFANHQWTASWEPCPAPDQHIGALKLTHSMNIFGKRFSPIDLNVERDVMIWNNKRYEAKPFFVKSKEDSLINKHRRWYSQFYSEHSPRLNFQKDTLD